MVDQPPTPSSAPGGPTIASLDSGESTGRIVVTTDGIAATLEDNYGVVLDRAVLEDLLLELERRGYLEWVTVTRNGDYVWDLTDAPDRIADAVAPVIVEAIAAWIGEGDDGSTGDN
ncbi:hypothetical protein [Halopiger goleimassiliensis]|uniref:hypothetical protein n=1 Tax=Halopiger goleimassiliensis TaxID=1293048 RepID=UPI0006776959|nr:hypothetical protein [Halopiger goleimassiliensis]